MTEGEDPQREPGPSPLAALVRLDEAFNLDIAELLRQHGRADHFRAQFADSKARSDSERRSAETKAERRLSPHDANACCSEQKCRGDSSARFFRQGEIDDDAAREEDRQPEEPAVGFGCHRAGRRGKACPHETFAPLNLGTALAPSLFVPVRHALLRTGRAAPSLPLPRTRPYVT